MGFREPRWSDVTAVFGGTFDPPHAGHREAVRGLFAHPGARQAVIVPAGTPPLKQEHASADQRLAMLRLAFAGFAAPLRIDERELRRSGPSFTFDTLSSLRPELGELAFVIGVDQLETLEKWHRFPEILSLCHWIVLERKPDGLARIERAMTRLEASNLARKVGQGVWELRGGTCLKRAETEAPELSSTGLRRELALRAADEKMAPFGLDPAVWQYLKDEGLYGTRRAHG